MFKLMLQSGVVKLVSEDPLYRNLTALTVHYETQPLPTWIGWYAHQLPLWFQKTSCAIMFFIEIAVPFLIFAPRRPRIWAAGALAFLQVLILLTGNYTFFNWLTLLLCIPLLDDAVVKKLSFWKRFAWAAKNEKADAAPSPRQSDSGTGVPPVRIANPASGHPLPRSERGRGKGEGVFRGFGVQDVLLGSKKNLPSVTPLQIRLRRWRRAVTIPLAAIIVAVTCLQLCHTFRQQPAMLRPVTELRAWLAPFRSLNSYGLFAVMTPSRPEIIVEGSMDGVTWRAYEFRYKPGDLRRRPGFVAPHQPRLDWQMWFAALGRWEGNPWFGNFCVRLLQGSPEVLALLAVNPFPDEPPRYLRATLYDYRFTDFAERRQTGHWWRREELRPYLPVISLQ